MNNNFTNAFTENMKEFMNPDNFTKQMKEFTNFDFSGVSEAMKKNSEMLTDAGRVASESAQSIMRRGVEIVQDNATNMFDTMKEVASSANPEQALARQQKFVQSFVKQTVNNTKEMMDMASKSAMEVFEKMSKHTSEHVYSAMETVTKKSKK